MDILKKGNNNLLATKGIYVLLAEGNNHQKVGLSEQVVWNVKQCLIQLFPTTSNCSDLFEFNHRLSLVSTFLNERPSFEIDNEVYNPHIFNISTLKYRSAQNDPPQLLSSLVFPDNREMADAINILTRQSQRILTTLASELSARILNFKNTTDQNKPQIDSFVYIVD